MSTVPTASVPMVRVQSSQSLVRLAAVFMILVVAVFAVAPLVLGPAINWPSSEELSFASR